MSDFGVPPAGFAGEATAAPAPAVPSQETPAGSRKAQPAGMWKVGSLHPAAVKVLTVLGFAIPVGAYLAMLAHYQVNAIWTDQWSDVQVIVQNYKHFPDWSSIWALHAENRMFFPNLIVIGLAHTASFNIDVEEYLSAMMLLGSVTMLIWAHKRRSPATPFLFYCPVAFVMLSFAQWQNTLWGFQLAWYLVLLSLTLSVVLLDRPNMAWPILIGAVLAAVVGSYSSIQGLLIWPIGLVLLYHRRRPAWTFISWIVVGLATTALYFYNYHAKSVSPLYALRHPFSSSKLFLFALGDVVGVQIPHGRVSPQLLLGESGHAIDTPGNAAVVIFGAVIFVLAVFVVVRWGIRRDPLGGTPIGIAMIVYGLLFGFFTTDGRVLFGYWGVSQSRYTTYDVLVLVGIYLTALSRAPVHSRTEHRMTTHTMETRPCLFVKRTRDTLGRVDRGAVARFTLGTMAILLVFSIHYGIAGARLEHQVDVRSVTLTRNIDHESELTVFSLDIGESPEMIKEDAAFLREHHLSLYG